MGCVIKYKGKSIPEEQFLQYLNKQITINNLFNENKTFANVVYEALGFNTNNLESFLDEIGLGFLLDSTSESYSIDKNKKHRLVKIKENTGEIDETKQIASYDPTTNTIIISKNATLKEIIHELIHHVLHREAVFFGDNLNLQGTRNKDQKYIDKGKVVGKKLKEHLLSNVKQYFGTEISKLLDYNENSRTYFEELLTYYLTSAKFREELDLLPAEIRDEILSIINELLENHFTEEQITKIKELSESYNSVNNQITPQQKQQAQQLYSEYLDTIFPDSKVKDIVYHSTIRSFDKFNKLPDYYFSGTNRDISLDIAINFKFNDLFEEVGEGINVIIKPSLVKEFHLNKQQEKKLIELYWERDSNGGEYSLFTLSQFREAYNRIVGEELEIFNPQVKSVLLNITNLKEEKDLPIEYDNVLKIKQTTPNIDGIVGKESLFKQKSNIDTYVVFEPEQIHILGNKQDVEGFRKFINKEEVDLLATNVSFGYNEQKEYYLAKNTKSLLEDIVKFSKDIDTKTLAKAVSQIPNIGKIKLEVIKYNAEEKTRGKIKDVEKASGVFRTAQNKIEIVGNLEKEAFETIFLHETIHAITTNEYYYNKEFAAKINILYSHMLKFKDYNTSTGVPLGKMYGMSNPREFMAEAMSNPAFIFELSKYYSPLQEKLKTKNIFQEFIDIISNMIKEKLKVKRKTYIENNLGQNVLNVISNYTKVSPSIFGTLFQDQFKTIDLGNGLRVSSLEIFSSEYDSMIDLHKCK